MDRREYLQEENWHGTYYEFSLELGPTGNDALALDALRTLWSQPALRWPWRDRSGFDTERDDAIISLEEVPLYGCLNVADGNEVGCTSQLIRLDDDSDLLDFWVPIGMLELRFPMTYPLDSATNPWMTRFEERLARIAAAISGVAPFRLGVIGEEASGALPDELTAADCESGGFLVPPDLWANLSPKRKLVVLANGVAYVPFIGPHITYGT